MLTEHGEPIPREPLLGEQRFQAALHSDHVRRSKLRDAKRARRTAADVGATDVATKAADDNNDNDNDNDNDKPSASSDSTWLNINDHLTLSRDELHKAATLVDLLRQRFATSELVAQPTADASAVEQQLRVGTHSKAAAMRGAAATMYARVSMLAEQVRVQRRFDAQLELLSRRWRLERSLTGALLFDFAPLLTAIGDPLAVRERALCECTRTGALGLRLPPPRWLLIDHVISVRRDARTLCTITGPIVAPDCAYRHDDVDDDARLVAALDALLTRAHRSTLIERIFRQVCWFLLLSLSNVTLKFYSLTFVQLECEAAELPSSRACTKCVSMLSFVLLRGCFSF